ncbi:MAG: hypothetical protein GWN58_40485 [Anaerolineae bacterium]|nr:hypothetical protein [Anaerolineae bacterium]
MGTDAAWHDPIVEQLSRFFQKEPDARAFVLTGSLADGEIQPDRWSDIDAGIVLADGVLDRYTCSTGWLQFLGQTAGLERHEHPQGRTLRVCLEGLRRLDLTFVSEPALGEPSSWDRNPFYPSFVVLWSELPGLEMQLASLPQPAEYREPRREEIEELVDAFWLKAAVATTRVVRDDLLIGSHLALDLARDCLLLQMMRRDRQEGTAIHRTGGWGNELAARVSWDGRGNSAEAILDLVRTSCEVFDELAPELLQGYNRRGPLLYPGIESARAICAARVETG